MGRLRVHHVPLRPRRPKQFVFVNKVVIWEVESRHGQFINQEISKINLSEEDLKHWVPLRKWIVTTRLDMEQGLPGKTVVTRKLVLFSDDFTHTTQCMRSRRRRGW